ncbi:MAG: alpha/beta fold hydrolase [Verrucomicrobiales bacterium]|nr:alpha/beta fold hydrolase [Verrucomicrobiales bacterium]
MKRTIFIGLVCLGFWRAIAGSPEGERTIDLGGRALKMRTYGSTKATPVVVIEAGMGEPPLASGSWRKVVEAVAATHRVVIYNRAGLGGSDPAPKLPRTSRDVAADLHALLTKAQIAGPYVLVGHSYGGLHLRVFAGEHPQSVAGLVLVDATHPDQDARWLASLPPATPNEPASVSGARTFLASRVSPDSNPEQIDPVASSAQVKAARVLGDKPLMILTHHAGFSVDPNLPAEVAAKIESVSQALAEEMKRLSTKSTLRRSVAGGHNLQAEDPQLVIDGIRDVLRAVAERR